ncbi:hypothetical protein GCM10022243_36620 [Saccharothrix violaceirubra]|uniref:Uncharacterized protein n=1 Tax=Saccharothrix violaceirubra TaxID=413306 RepID=A0A7W7WWX0_9PSEU|nr:hypothetical protein [Saccharothrix violaceirubra]MBB4966422.1 hypothetical protein [Saccharothrix violaceirubra]
MRLSELLDLTSLDVLDHVAREIAVPVVDGPHAQGDLLVLPYDLVSSVVRIAGGLREVPRAGVELVRGAAGGNPHTLTADENSTRWTPGVHDPLGLAVAYLENATPAYLIHPEHGATGLAPGRWLVRRQREYVPLRRRVGSLPFGGGSVLVAD